MKELCAVYVEILNEKEYLKALLILNLYSKKEHDKLQVAYAKERDYVGFLFINKSSSIGYIDNEKALKLYNQYTRISYQDLLANY